MELQRPREDEDDEVVEESVRDLDNFKNRIKLLTEKARSLEVEKTELSKRNENLITGHKNRITELNNQIQLLQRELTSVKNEKGELENKSKLQNTQTDQQVVTLSSRIDSLNQQMLDLQASKSKLENEYRNKLAEKDEQIKKLSGESLTLTEYIQKLKDEKEILENVKIASEKKINELKLDQQKVQDLQNQLQVKEKEIIRLRSGIQKVENTLTKSELEVQAFKAQQEKIKQEPQIIGTILKKIKDRYEVKSAGQKLISSAAADVPESKLMPGTTVALSLKSHLILEIISDLTQEALVLGRVLRKTPPKEILVQISGTNYLITNSLVPFNSLFIGMEVGVDPETHTIVKMFSQKQPAPQAISLAPKPTPAQIPTPVIRQPVTKGPARVTRRPSTTAADKNVKFCVQCGTKNRNKAVFCSFCGAKFK